MDDDDETEETCWLDFIIEDSRKIKLIKSDEIEVVMLALGAIQKIRDTSKGKNDVWKLNQVLNYTLSFLLFGVPPKFLNQVGMPQTQK